MILHYGIFDNYSFANSHRIILKKIKYPDFDYPRVSGNIFVTTDFSEGKAMTVDDEYTFLKNVLINMILIIYCITLLKKNNLEFPKLFA